MSKTELSHETESAPEPERTQEQNGFLNDVAKLDREDGCGFYKCLENYSASCNLIDNEWAMVKLGDGTKVQISTYTGTVKTEDGSCPCIIGSYSWGNAFVDWVLKQPSVRKITTVKGR